MYLFFDTETTGLPLNWKSPITDLDNWPRLVQIAWIVYDKKGKKLNEKNYIIKPDGYSIPIDVSRIHGITTTKANKEGHLLQPVLTEFNQFVEKANYLVAHNISFDEKIVGAEFLRLNFKNAIATKRKICTMHSTTQYCALPGPYGYKWPKLSELHHKLFNKGYKEAHNASVDIKITAKCFWELKRRGIV